MEVNPVGNALPLRPWTRLSLKGENGTELNWTELNGTLTDDPEDQVDMDVEQDVTDATTNFTADANASQETLRARAQKLQKILEAQATRATLPDARTVPDQEIDIGTADVEQPANDSDLEQPANDPPVRKLTDEAEPHFSLATLRVLSLASNWNEWHYAAVAAALCLLAVAIFMLMYQRYETGPNTLAEAEAAAGIAAVTKAQYINAQEDRPIQVRRTERQNPTARKTGRKTARNTARNQAPMLHSDSDSDGDHHDINEKEIPPAVD